MCYKIQREKESNGIWGVLQIVKTMGVQYKSELNSILHLLLEEELYINHYLYLIYLNT